MDLWVVKYASRRSRIGDWSGHSSARGARIRGFLASQASAGQRGLSAQGVEPDGRGIRGRDQAIWSRSNDRAGDWGGARADKPRWVRILAITGGSSMAAMIVKVPPLLADTARCRYRIPA
jgi:hypothetical protein